MESPAQNEHRTALENRLTVPVNAPLVARMEDLVRVPEFHFLDLEDLVRAALYSFVAFKERQLSQIRREGRWGRGP